MSSQRELIRKLDCKEAVIGVIGLGYVGLPLMLRYCDAGYHVVGFDIDELKIDKISNCKSYIEHIDSNVIKKAVDSGKLKATSDFSILRSVNAIILCVPTPLSEHREPDLSFVLETVDCIIPYLEPFQVLSLESTTYPGTTEEELKPRVESSGLEIGKDIFLVYSPEREDPGNEQYSLSSIPKVCGGISSACLEIGMSLYGQVVKTVVPVSSTKAAEMTKLLENIHRAVNIGLVNELKIVADKMGVDIYEVIDAAATKPFGFTPYYPGPGLGGHCIPIDPFYLTWKAKEYGVNTRFIELAGEVNTAMPQWVVTKLTDALNNKAMPLKNSKILILGIAYKKDVDDVRESPAVEIMEILRGKGAILDYSDNHVPVFPKMRGHSFDLKSISCTENNLRKYDAAVLVTDHSDFDYELIDTNSSLLIDTRGKYRTPEDHITKA